jgi:tetratricopeptide (TPR) repeat protein
MTAGHYAMAIAIFNELLAWDPPDAASREKAFAGIGFSYASQGRLDRAIRAFDSALEVNPSNVVMHKNLALIHIKQGHPDLARPHVERFAALRPDDPALKQLEAALGEPPRP